ncbi:MAG: addiction module protein [Gallionella sp.]|nr:addiction module protein [Gallionella sp.]
MNITAQLDQLSTADKLRTMEYLWDDLCRHAEEVPSPAWHGEVLAERERAVAEGSAVFRDWEAEKTRIRDSLK